MPKTYICGKFLFNRTMDCQGGAYYNIVNTSAGGRTWDYDHWFTSKDEMDEYARNNLERVFAIYFFLLCGIGTVPKSGLSALAK